MTRRERFARAIYNSHTVSLMIPFDQQEPDSPWLVESYAAADAIEADVKRVPHRIGQAFGAAVASLLATVVILALVGCVIALARWIA